MSDDNCLDASSAHGPVNLVRCHGMQGNQEWNYDETVNYFYFSRIFYIYKNYVSFSRT